MLGSNPKWPEAEAATARYWQIRRTAPLKTLLSSVLSTSFGIGAAEAFTHRSGAVGVGCTVLALYAARNVYNGVTEPLIDTHLAGVDEGIAIGEGFALERQLVKELSPDDEFAGELELQEIWRRDPEYRGGQVPEPRV